MNLSDRIETNFDLNEWSRRALEAYNHQWLGDDHRENDWDWPEIFRSSENKPQIMSLAIWGSDDRLSCLALMEAKADSVAVKLLEGDPRADCPLVGRRALVVFEVAACYAQVLGKKEIGGYPINETVAAVYRDVYGFALANPGHNPQYYSKEI